MRIVASPTRRHHDTTSVGTASRLWLAALAALAGTTALAQSAVPCTAIEDDAQRLACYDRALRPAPAPRPTPAPAAQPSAAPPSTAVAPTEGRRERRVRESSAAAPPPAPAAPAATAAPAAPRPTLLGSRAEDTIVPIVVIAIRALPGREATFTAEDGSRWVQTDSQRVNVPDTPFAAEIRPGAMGSYFLVPTERGRGVRVRQAAR